jgi:hypothetical protein
MPATAPKVLTCWARKLGSDGCGVDAGEFDRLRLSLHRDRVHGRLANRKGPIVDQAADVVQSVASKSRELGNAHCCGRVALIDLECLALVDLVLLACTRSP